MLVEVTVATFSLCQLGTFVDCCRLEDSSQNMAMWYQVTYVTMWLFVNLMIYNALYSSWLHTSMRLVSLISVGMYQTSTANPSRGVFSGRHVSCWSARWQRAVGFGSQSTRWRQAGALGLGSHPWHGGESSIFSTRFAFLWVSFAGKTIDVVLLQFLFFHNNYCIL